MKFSPGVEAIRRLTESELVINSRGDSKLIFPGGASIILEDRLKLAVLDQLAGVVDKVAAEQIEEIVAAGVRQAALVLTIAPDALGQIILGS